MGKMITVLLTGIIKSSTAVLSGFWLLFLFAFLTYYTQLRYWISYYLLLGAITLANSIYPIFKAIIDDLFNVLLSAGNLHGGIYGAVIEFYNLHNLLATGLMVFLLKRVWNMLPFFGK
jgi:hypothetical protein